MKIAMIVNNLAVSGGYQKLVIRFSQSLTKKGHDVTIYTPNLDIENCYPDDIKYLNIVTLDPKDNIGGPLEQFTILADKVKESDAMVIHDELSLICVALIKNNRPKRIVWMLNNQLPADLTKKSFEAINVYKQTVGTLKTKLKEAYKGSRRIGLINQGLRHITSFATYDSFNKELVEKNLKRQATIVSAGADLESFKKLTSNRLTKKHESYEVLSVGVLFPHRRYEDLIEAIPLILEQGFNINARIVGRQDLSPDYFKLLQNLVKKNGLEKRVIFNNFVSDKEMLDLYRNADIFAFINDGFTWGISVFESIAAKLPVIITNNIGAADSITQGKTGWLVNPKSPQEVADAVVEIINDSNRTKIIVDRAYDKLTAYVDWDKYTDRMLKLMK